MLKEYWDVLGTWATKKDTKGEMKQSNLEWLGYRQQMVVLSDPSSTKTDVDSGHFNDMVKDFAKTKFCRFKPMLLKWLKPNLLPIEIHFSSVDFPKLFVQIQGFFRFPNSIFPRIALEPETQSITHAHRLY